MKITRSFWSVSAAALAVAAGLVVLSPADAPAVAQGTPAPATGGFAVDEVHSSVVYRVKHMNVAYFYGTFKKVAGSFNIDAASPDKSAIDITVDAASVDSRNAGRDKHLMGPDFFSVKEFPAITFKSTKVAKGSGENNFELTGNLTFLGVTKPITAKLEFTGQGAGREPGSALQGFEARFTFKRTDFGNNYMVGKGLSDEIDMVVAIEGSRK